jgi:hypothetical protein
MIFGIRKQAIRKVLRPSRSIFFAYADARNGQQFPFVIKQIRIPWGACLLHASKKTERTTRRADCVKSAEQPVLKRYLRGGAFGVICFNIIFQRSAI